MVIAPYLFSNPGSLFIVSPGVFISHSPEQGHSPNLAGIFRVYPEIGLIHMGDIIGDDVFLIYKLAVDVGGGDLGAQIKFTTSQRM